MSVFNTDVVDHLKQPLFFGDEPGVARYETVKHPVFEDLTEKTHAFFWRPAEIDLTLDKQQYDKMSKHEQFVFTENLKYQTLLDSVQGRSPSLAFLPIVSDIALETWIQTWSFSETIHSRSYTHIMRNIYPDPSVEFDSIVLNDAIMKRALAVSKYYDDLISIIRRPGCKAEVREKALYLCMHAVNALEAIRFYVSFACTFNFAEQGKMEGNAKIMKLIARDEQLHLKGTQYIINQLRKELDWKPEWDIEAAQLFVDVAAQEKEWIEHLFVEPIPGLNKKLMADYVDYLAESRMKSVKLPVPAVVNSVRQHPLPWIRKWLNSDNVQVAAQEAELSSYLIGQVDNTLTEDDFADFKALKAK